MKSNQGLVLWLTGLPCSGKSTIASELEKYFQRENKAVQILDGDLIRSTISKDLGYSATDRYNQCERVAYIANMLSTHGINVIVALVSPYQTMRKHAREICANMKEIYIRCSLEECKKRDVKGMYKKALNGEIQNFTGVTAVYETPSNPDLIVDTEHKSLKRGVMELIDSLFGGKGY